MNNLVKCDGGECPLKNTCDRYTRPTGLEEAIYMEPPFKGNECAYYIPNDEEKIDD